MNKKVLIRKIEEFKGEENKPYESFYIGITDHPHQKRPIKLSLEADNHETAKDVKDYFTASLHGMEDGGEDGETPKHVYIYTKQA